MKLHKYFLKLFTVRRIIFYISAMVLIILKIFLIILGILFLFLAGILFIPFRIKLCAAKKDKDIRARGSVYWISWLFNIRAVFDDKQLKLYIVLLGIPIKIPLQGLQKKSSPGKEKSESPEKKGKSPEISPEQEKKGHKDTLSPDKETGENKEIKGEKKGGFREKIAHYKPFLQKTLFPQLQKMKSYFHLSIRQLDLVYGSKDPAMTGYIQGAVSSIKPFMTDNHSCSFLSTQFCYYKKSLDFYVDLYFSMNLYGIVIRLFIIWWHYRKLSSSQRRINHEPDPGKTS